MKNAVVGDGSKVPHLSYVGDADDRRAARNIGAATVFVNYDGAGQAPHRRRRRRPRSAATRCWSRRSTIGDGAYTAAGSVITEDVPPGRDGGGPRRASATSRAGCARKRPGSPPAAQRRLRPRVTAARTQHGRAGAADGRRRRPRSRARDRHQDERPRRRSCSSPGGRTPSSPRRSRRDLGVELTPTTAYDFANGEIFVRFEESVRGCDAFVLQSHTAPINKWIMEQLIMVDALKRASAKRITVVVPFYGYARQDKKHRGREPISARLIADLFKTAGADRLMTVDLHTAQIQGFFDGPVDHLFALPLLADYVEQQASTRAKLTVVSPGRRPGAGRRALDRPARRAAGDHPQAPRPGRPQRGQGLRGRR